LSTLFLPDRALSASYAPGLALSAGQGIVWSQFWWAIMHGNRRWMTLLWIVASLVATLVLFAGAALIWPDLTEMFGHMALISSLLISAL
jgi:hypothetical protein